MTETRDATDLNQSRGQRFIQCFVGRSHAFMG